MARKLDAQETIAFAEELKDQESSTEELWLQSLGQRRDAILCMSPELREFFDRELRQLLAGR